MKIKKRLDQALHEMLPDLSRNQVSSFIMQGLVTVDGKIVTKPGALVSEDAVIETKITEPKYVSRAGFKLEKALDEFGIDVQGLVALDAGISTGGFSDCLLQRGIKKIYGVDVGYGQVHEKVTADDRVVVMERTNLRELTELPEKVDIVTLDLSFISVLKVMDAVSKLIKEDGKLIVLIKPQFEARREQISRGGIVKDPKAHQEVINRITQGIKEYGFECKGVTESPITGSMGNKEFLAYFVKK